MRVALTIAVVSTCACRFEPVPAADSGAPEVDADAGPDADTGPWLPGFDYRRRVTITSGVATTLDDFVVALVVPDDANLAAHARPDSRGFAITADDATTVLDFEVERFDGTAGALATWVRIPHLTPVTIAYLYYGAAAADLQDRAGTWTASTFRAVWHLSDPGPGAAPDSAGAFPLASPGGREPMTQSPARVANGRRFDGVDDALRVADSPGLDFGLMPFTYAVWVNVTLSAGTFDMPMFKGGGSANTPGYDFELGTSEWRAFVGDGVVNPSVTFGTEVALLGSWVHLVTVVDRKSDLLRAYLNGIETDTQNIATLGSISSALTLTLGTNDAMSFPFSGQLDEPRIYARALEPDWIAAEYANVSMPSTFAALEPEQAR